MDYNDDDGTLFAVTGGDDVVKFLLCQMALAIRGFLHSSRGGAVNDDAPQATALRRMMAGGLMATAWTMWRGMEMSSLAVARQNARAGRKDVNS